MSCLLASERASLSQASLTTGGLAQDSGAGSAGDNGLSMGEDGRDVEASRALDVHEERSGRSDELLELVLFELSLRRRVKQILGQNHGVCD